MKIRNRHMDITKNGTENDKQSHQDKKERVTASTLIPLYIISLIVSSLKNS